MLNNFNFKKIFLVVVIGLLLLAIFALGYILLKGATNSIDQYEEMPEPKGIMIFSGLKKTDEATGEIFPKSYYIDLSDKESGYVEAPRTPSMIYSAFSEFLDPSDPGAFVFRTMYTNSGERVVLFGLDNTPVQVLNIDTNKNPQQFTWSGPSALLAYRVSSSSDPNPVLFDNASIEIFDVAKDEVIKTIKSAGQPQWLPDGTTLVYLKSGGLYSYDFLSQAEDLVAGPVPKDIENNFFDVNSKLGVSPNGSYLVWTSLPDKKISLYTIQSWKPFRILWLKDIKEENTEYYWPVFSSDSQFYSVLAIDSAPDPKDRTNARIEVRSVSSDEVLLSYSLTDFDFNRLFNDDWISGMPSTLSGLLQ